MTATNEYQGLLADRHLRPLDKLIYLVLKFRQGRNGCAWPSLSRVAQDVGGVSEDTVRRSIGRLEEQGWLKIIRPEDQGRGKTNQYVTATPQKGSSRAAKRVANAPAAYKVERLQGNTNTFDIFWRTYPRRNGRVVGKKDCRAWWNKHNPDPSIVEQMIRWLECDARSRAAADAAGEFYPNPKDPIRWLKGEGWLDEIDESPGHAADDEPGPAEDGGFKAQLDRDKQSRINAAKEGGRGELKRVAQ
jgi:hypothetical protein